MTITALPSPPSSSMSQAAFIAAADAWVAALATWTTEVNAAAAAFGVTMWVSGTTYALGDRVWSPVDYQTYRRIVAGAGTTDPSADTTNWALVIIILPYIHIRDQKADTTHGGTFTAGAWRTRDLNTEVADAGGYASVAANQVTLAAGTYRFHARAPAFSVAAHKCRLANITDSIYYYGSSESTAAAVSVVTSSVVAGRFTIAAAKVFELQHYCASTQATNGFGNACSFGVIEVYGEVEFWKEL